MKIWFTSDWHLSHKNVIGFKNLDSKFWRRNILDVSTIEEHDELIYDAVLSKVQKRDILYVLGDNGDASKAFELLSKCKANQIRYIPGNHDHCKQIALLSTIPKLMVFPPANYKNHIVTHQPIHTRELYGKKNIHGHVHSKSIKDSNYINVSVEAAGKDVLVDFELIKSGEYITYNN